MKKIINNKKGFTLIEVIMTVAILSVVTLIVVPSISGLMNKSNQDSYENLKKSIISATKTYVSDNRYNLDISCPSSTSMPVFNVSLQQLVDAGNLTSPIKDPRTKETISLDNIVKVTFNCGNKTFNYQYIE